MCLLKVLAWFMQTRSKRNQGHISLNQELLQDLRRSKKDRSQKQMEANMDVGCINNPGWVIPNGQSAQTTPSSDRVNMVEAFTQPCDHQAHGGAYVSSSSTRWF